MPKTLAQVLVAAVITLAVWLLGGRDWPLLVVGAVLSLSLWVMLFAGSWGGRRTPGLVATRDYALGGALGVALGYVMSLVGEGATWWAVGFILAGVMVPSAVAATSSVDSDEQ